jgi:hypothetical protein
MGAAHRQTGHPLAVRKDPHAISIRQSWSLANAVCCPEIAGWGSRCNSIE